jgi:HisA/HisF family protein
VIGAIDLTAGRAVHARAGRRADYQPVRVVDGDPVALAGLYRAQGVNELYVADLDAIAGAAPQDDQLLDLVRIGMPVSLDAGIWNDVRALHAVNMLGVERVIVGLETLPSFEALDVVCISIGGERVAFSLDLRDSIPVDGSDLLRTVSRAVQSGARTMIVIDMARVGTNAGVDIDLISAVRAAAPDVSLLVGGGIRGLDDVMQLSSAGCCDGVIVATMLQSVKR